MYPVALPFGFSGTISPGLLVGGRVLLLGFSMSEVIGNSAVRTIFDGGTGGVNVFRVGLQANETTREWFAPQGVVFEQGVFIQANSGNVTGSILCVPTERIDDYGYLFTESTG